MLEQIINKLFQFSNIFLTMNPFKIIEFKELVKGVKFSNKDRILDLGCGNGMLTFLLGKKSEKIYGVDLSKKSTAVARYRSQFIKNLNSEFKATPLEKAGFPDNHFSKIFSICVVEHIANYEIVLKEIYRILKEGGQLRFSVDSFQNINDEDLILAHKKKYSVEHFFTKSQLMRDLKKIGFKDIVIYPIFGTKYAKRLFKRGFYRNFKFGYVSFLLKYWKLKYDELKNRPFTKGIYLIIHCKK